MWKFGMVLLCYSLAIAYAALAVNVTPELLASLDAVCAVLWLINGTVWLVNHATSED